MYARVSTGQVPLERLEEVIGRARGQMEPLAERGFRGNMTLLDRQTGKCIIVGLWESEADLQATMPRH